MSPASPRPHQSPPLSAALQVSALAALSLTVLSATACTGSSTTPGDKPVDDTATPADPPWYVDATLEPAFQQAHAVWAGTAILDYDNDGWLDIFFTNGTNHADALYHNNGDGTFSDVAQRAGLTHTASTDGSAMAADLDNDGDEDLVLAGACLTGTYELNGASKDDGTLSFLRNNGDGTFSAYDGLVSPKLKSDYEILCHTGMTAADVDNDGFTDIVGHWAEEFINQMANLGIVSGKTATMFAPDDRITRAELTKIATKAFEIEIDPNPSLSPFSDVSLTEWFAPYIVAARDAGIVKGYDGNIFSPNGLVNRAEALKIILEAAGLGGTEAESLFEDVALTDWFAGYVTFAQKSGIVSGRTPTTFVPADNITRAEVAKIVVKVMDLPPDESADEGEPDL